MTGAKRCDEVIRLLDEALEHHERSTSAWLAPLPRVGRAPVFHPDVRTATEILATSSERLRPAS